MGPRIREDTGGEGHDNEIPRLRFAALGMRCGRRALGVGSGVKGTGGSRTAPTVGGEPGDGMGPRVREDTGGRRVLTEGVEAVNIHHGVHRFQRLAGRVLHGGVPIPDAPTQGLLGQ